MDIIIFGFTCFPERRKHMVTVVTGATGFIGGALVEELLRRGEKVRALVRKTSNTTTLKNLNVEIAYGEMLDRSSLEVALDGCDCLYHTAALIWAADYRHLKEVNAGGTKSLLEAALKKGVKKVIYTSSGSTLCPERGGTLTEDPPQRRQYLGTYAESKWLADQEAFKLQERGLPLVSIHPTYVYGPSMVSGWNKAILDFIKGNLPVVPTAYLNLVFIDDVVQGHILAQEKMQAGRRYLISGETIEVAQMMELAAEIAGVKIKARRFPGWVVAAYAYAGETVAKVTKKRPLITREVVRTLASYVTVDNSRTQGELGYTPTSLRQGLEKTVRWLQQSELPVRAH